MPVLYVIVGWPGSGKTTFARNSGIPRVSHDSICRMLTGVKFRPEMGQVYQEIEEMVAARLLADGYDVIIDHNHLARHERGRWIEFGHRQGAQVVCVVLATALAAAKHRNYSPERLAAQHYARESTYQALAASAVPPSLAEGMDVILYLLDS